MERKVDYQKLWERLYESLDSMRDHRDYLDIISTKMERMVADELRKIENAKTWGSLKEVIKVNSTVCSAPVSVFKGDKEVCWECKMES